MLVELFGVRNEHQLERLRTCRFFALGEVFLDQVFGRHGLDAGVREGGLEVARVQVPDFEGRVAVAGDQEGD